MKKIDIVIFDLDSTLVGIEGLDWLASLKRLDGKIKNLTKKSMEGEIEFGQALKKKMQLIAPSLSDIRNLGEAYCQNIVAGAEETIQFLNSEGIEVWILTGNFEPAVSIVGRRLGIPAGRIISNKIFFDKKGSYVDFDSESPLSNNGGKAEMITKTRQFKGKKIVYVGDGITDLEVKNSVFLFIGFGGVIERPIVKDCSDIYIFEPSLGSLPKILNLRR